MRKWLNGALALCVVAGCSLPATAQDKTEDEAAVERAYDALMQQDFKKTVDEADAVIKPFERRREKRTMYLCDDNKVGGIATVSGSAVDLFGLPNRMEGISQATCEAYFLKGFALIDLGKSKKALPFLEAAVDMDSDNQHYLNELAEWHKADRNWKKSLAVFTKASELAEPSDDADWKDMQCRSLRGIGFNQIELGDVEAAKVALKKCLELLPYNRGALNELEYIRHHEWKQN